MFDRSAPPRSTSALPCARTVRLRRSAVLISAAAAAVALACSAPPGSDDVDGAPEFVGPVNTPGAQTPSTPAGTNANTGNGVPTPGASNEGQGSVPVANGASNGAQTGASNTG